MATTPKKLLVLGGTGFVGREICRRAAKLGIEVTSLSRRGRISYAYLTAEDVRSWEHRVTWRIGDASNKEILEILIPQHDAIVHSVGIMFENNCNTLVSGSKTSGSGMTYEQINMETALVPLDVMQQCAAKGIPKPFIFISASSSLPFLKRYLTTKLAVEKRMREKEAEKVIRSVIFRPGIIYHHSKWTSLPIARMITAINSLDGTCSKKLGFSFGVPEPTPLDLMSTVGIPIAPLLLHNVMPVGVFTNKEMWDLTSSEKPEI